VQNAGKPVDFTSVGAFIDAAWFQFNKFKCG